MRVQSDNRSSLRGILTAVSSSTPMKSFKFSFYLRRAIYADIYGILDARNRSLYLHLDFAIYWIFHEIDLQDQIDFALLRARIMTRGFLLDDLLSHDHVKFQSRPLHKKKSASSERNAAFKLRIMRRLPI